MLVVDAGNALFREPSEPTTAAREHALAVVDAMAAAGTAAMAAGARDLSAGVAFLRDGARRAKLTVLSANLLGGDGKPIFPASAMVAAGGFRVGVVGLSPEGPVRGSGSVRGAPLLPAALAELGRLEEADLRMVLAAVPFDAALELSRGIGARADLILQSHENRGVAIGARDGNLLLSTGERGRGYGRMALSLTGRGPLLDLSQIEQDRLTVGFLEEQIAQTRRRLEGATGEELRRALGQTLKGFELRRDETARAVAAAERRDGRRITSLRFILLGSDVPDDPVLRARIARLP